VAKINYDIDLRSPDYRNRSRIFKPKTIRVLLYLLTIVLLIGFCFLLDSYRIKLQDETELFKKELAAKTEETAPLLTMSAELETYKQRNAIAEKLLSGYLFKAEYLEAMIMAAPSGLKLSYLAIDAEGKLELKGNGTTLQSAALYARKLQELPFISKAELTTADLNEESSCFFSITADLHQAAGGDALEQ
jgi:hypothetical protein